MLKWFETTGRKYLKLFAHIEGPELEPTMFHSHYLSARATAATRQTLQSLLYGDVLDVGAGTGYGKRLLPDNANYFPTDIDGARDYRDKSLTRNGVALAKHCSVYHIDYLDNRFDGCLALSLFEHLEQPDKAIAEIRRVVKDNGLIVLMVPFSFPIHGYPADYWRWTVEGLKRFLGGHGAQVIDCFACGKSIHSIALNLNLFLREGMILEGHKPSTPRLFFYVIIRPFLTLLFFLINALALMLGAFDKSTTLPILICAVGRNIKH